VFHPDLYKALKKGPKIIQAVYNKHYVGLIEDTGTRRYWLYRPESKGGLERNVRQAGASRYLIL